MPRHADRYWYFWNSLIAEIGRVRPALGNQLLPSKKAGIRLEHSAKPGATYRLWWSGNARAKRLRAEFFVRGNRELYRSLTEHRFDIEEAFGGRLEWEPLVGVEGMRDGGNTYSRIFADHGSTYELSELPTAEALCPWILDTLDRLKDAINPILLVLLGHLPPSSLSGDEAGVQVPEGQAMPEGAITRVEVLRYERSAAARAACLEHFKYRCQVCELNFEERYGEVGRDFMHVHHIVPLHEVADIPDYRVDPIKDLRPVCPNCHAMLHRPRDRTLTVEELRDLLQPGDSSSG